MRTVIKVWEGASDDDRKDMVARIMTQGKVAPSTVYMWMRGERKPQHLYQKLIQTTIHKVTGNSIPLSELFSQP